MGNVFIVASRFWILDKRLEAVPWARHCLRCQDLNERGLLHREEE